LINNIFAFTLPGIAGVIKKMSIEQGWEFFPDTPLKQYGGLNIADNDWTIMADRPKNWTTEKKA